MNRSCISLIAFTALWFMVGCSNVGEEGLSGPKAKIDLSNVSELIVLDSVSFTIEGSSKGGLTSALADVNINGQVVETLYTLGVDSSSVKIKESITFIIDPTYAGENILLSFSVTNLKGQVASDTVAFGVKESQIDTFDDNFLGSYGNLNYGSFYDLVEDTAFFDGNLGTTQKKRSIDIVFCHAKNEGYVLAAPSSGLAEDAWSSYSSSTWPLFGVENTTLLYDLGTSVNYDAIVTAIQIENIFSSGSVVDSVTNLTAGQVLGYKLASLRGTYKGIIKVSSLSGSGTNAVMSFDFKRSQQ